MVSPSGASLQKRAQSAADELLQRTRVRPRLGMLLGTGHASITAQLKKRVQLRGQELPGGLRLADESHLVFGELDGVPIVVGDAPLAPYEGWGSFEVTFPVRVLRALGVELLVLTAGAASLSRHLEPGTVAVIEDHLNFTNLHPLQGPHEEGLGPRFPDMSNPYPSRWRRVAREVGNDIGMSCLEAVFAAVPGPSLPTRAEYRFLRRAGADLVGMSLVPEVVTAVHAGLDVLALVGITQLVHIESEQPADIEQMLDAADLAAPRMASLLAGIVSRFG